jgi:N-acetylglutamate synthase-like GNAT family acetyltransferase
LKSESDQATSYHIRAAQAADAAAIRSLILRVGINPTGLSWRRFVVAVAADGTLVGTGQVKPHRDGSLELASIAVQPGWRRRGVARTIIERLLAEHPGPVYLTCRAKLGPFYEKFGFERVAESEMPAYYLKVSRVFNFIQSISGVRAGLWVMRRAG